MSRKPKLESKSKGVLKRNKAKRGSRPTAVEAVESTVVSLASRRPKIGDKLNPRQLQNIKSFCEFIDAGIETDEYIVFPAAAQQLANFKTLLAGIRPNVQLTDDQLIALTNFYQKLHEIHDNNKADPSIPELPNYNPGRLARACAAVIADLNTPSPEFLAAKQKQDLAFANLTRDNQAEDENLARHNIPKNTVLVKMLQQAIQPGANYKITPNQVAILKDALGPQFNTLINRYDLNAEKLTLDDLRMLIVGVVANTNDDSIKSTFMQGLCHAFDISDQSKTAQFELKSKLSASFLHFNQELQPALNKIKKQPPAKIFNRIINHFRTWLPDNLKHFIAERSDTHKNFIDDLNTATTVSNVTNWQRKASEVHGSAQEIEQAQIEQRTAANEYLFHKLAQQKIQDGTIVPVIEPDGEMRHYKAYNLLNKTGIKSMALVPVDVSKSPLDVKVLFAGTNDVGEAIVHGEKYGAGHSSYHKNEAELFCKLNDVVGRLKAKAVENGNSTPEVSLTAGGHSLGGALAQNFSASMVKLQLQKLFDKHAAVPVALKQQLLLAIIQQIKHEIDIGYNNQIEITDDDKIAELAEKRFTGLRKAVEKQQNKQKPIAEQETDRFMHNKKLIARDQIQVLEKDHLDNITNMRFVTFNSAGVAFKVRNIVADGLAVLHTPSTANAPEIKFNQVMVGGDVVQQTGQDNVTSAIPKAHMVADVVKIDAELEGVAKGKLQNAAAAFIAVSYFAANYIAMLMPVVKGLYSSKKLYSAVDDITKAHTSLHYEDPHKDVEFKHYSNQDDSSKEHLYELTKKIPLVNSQYYQQTKKHLNNIVKSMYSLFMPAVTKAQAAEAGITKGLEKVVDQFGKDNLREFTVLLDPEHAKLAKEFLGPKAEKLQRLNTRGSTPQYDQFTERPVESDLLFDNVEPETVPTPSSTPTAQPRYEPPSDPDDDTDQPTTPSSRSSRRSSLE